MLGPEHYYQGHAGALVVGAILLVLIVAGVTVAIMMSVGARHDTREMQRELKRRDEHRGI